LSCCSTLAELFELLILPVLRTLQVLGWQTSAGCEADASSALVGLRDDDAEDGRSGPVALIDRPWLIEWALLGRVCGLVSRLTRLSRGGRGGG